MRCVVVRGVTRTTLTLTVITVSDPSSSWNTWNGLSRVYTTVLTHANSRMGAWLALIASMRVSCAACARVVSFLLLLRGCAGRRVTQENLHDNDDDEDGPDAEEAPLEAPEWEPAHVAGLPLEPPPPEEDHPPAPMTLETMLRELRARGHDFPDGL